MAVSANLLVTPVLFQLFLPAGISIRGKKGAHMKAHLGWDVLEGYAHRAGASSEAATAEAITATIPADVADAGRDVVTFV